MCAVYLLLLLLPLVSAQTYHWGPCPTPKVQPNFDLQRVNTTSPPHTHTHICTVYILMGALCEQYLGRWYEIEKLPASFERGKCIEANYAVRKDGTIEVLNVQF